MDYTTRPPFVVDENIRIVLESLSGTELGKVSAQLVDFKSGDIARKVLDMGADVAEATSGSGYAKIVSSPASFTIG